MFTMIFKKDGESINYADSGEGKPAMVFSHGFFLDLSMFDAQISRFSKSFRCIAWDERGFGGSSVSDWFNYWDSANDLIGLLDHLNIEEAVLVGMSKGGFISLRAGIAYPDRVKAIILIASDSKPFTQEQMREYREVLDKWCTASNIDELAENIGELIFGVSGEKAHWINKWKQSDRAVLQYPAQALLEREDITDRLSEIKCPVLVIHGDEDEAIPISNAEILSKKIGSGARLIRIQGAPHAPNITHPEETNSAIHTFLKEISD